MQEEAAIDQLSSEDKELIATYKQKILESERQKLSNGQSPEKGSYQSSELQKGGSPQDELLEEEYKAEKDELLEDDVGETNEKASPINRLNAVVFNATNREEELEDDVLQPTVHTADPYFLPTTYHRLRDTHDKDFIKQYIDAQIEEKERAISLTHSHKPSTQMRPEKKMELEVPQRSGRRLFVPTMEELEAKVQDRPREKIEVQGERARNTQKQLRPRMEVEADNIVGGGKRNLGEKLKPKNELIANTLEHLESPHEEERSEHAETKKSPAMQGERHDMKGEAKPKPDYSEFSGDFRMLLENKYNAYMKRVKKEEKTTKTKVKRASVGTKARITKDVGKMAKGERNAAQKTVQKTTKKVEAPKTNKIVPSHVYKQRTKYFDLASNE